MKSLEYFIKSKCEATDSEWAHFTGFLQRRTYKKEEFLFTQGEESDLIGFVASGLVYSYYTSSDCEVKVKKFAWEGRITSPYSTLISGSQACYFSAVALENSEVICLKYSDLQKLFSLGVTWQKLGRVIVEESLVERELREYETLCLSLEDRYSLFLQRHQNILDRVPQYLIASYLGINPASLSRLRAQIFKKN